MNSFFSRGPFAGVNLLENLLKSKGQLAPELHLLHCLELIHLGDKDPAGKALKLYTSKLTDDKTNWAHPLYLLARARLTDQQEEVWNLVTKFAELYPEAVDKVSYVLYIFKSTCKKPIV